MTTAHEFLKNLALVLGAAAVTTVVCHKLRQPVVLGYLLAGLVIGPHVPVPLVADQDMVRALSELGVVLVMFSLGLELRLRKLVKLGPSVALTSLVEISIMLSLGFAAGRALGWPPQSSFVVGALVAISSTTVIAKAFGEAAITGRLRGFVFGLLIFEDLAAVLLLTLLTALASGVGLTSWELATTLGRLGAFLAALLALGMLTVPRAFRAIVHLGRPETTLIAAVGLCFGVALLAQAFGYSVALGAFLAGTLVAESGEERKIVPLVRPVRDIFAAIFFVAAGMSIDPPAVARHWAAVLGLVALIVAGKIASVAVGTFLTGNGTRLSLQAGMSLAQIGEFSFIIAALAAAEGVVPAFLYPVVVAAAALTTLFTPWLVRISPRAADALDRALPARLATFAALYAGWVEQIRRPPAQPTAGARVRRLVLLLSLDGFFIGALVIGASVEADAVTGWLVRRLGIGSELAFAIVLGGTLAAIAPFCAGVLRLARQLGRELGEWALPGAAAGKADLAAAPRRALVVALQLLGVLLVGAPLVAVTQPFLPPLGGAAVFLIALGVLAVAFWRSATDLEEHVQAGAQVIVETLAAHSHRRVTGEHILDDIHKVLPGLGTPVPLRLSPGDAGVGKTLAELNLRSLTGATVLAVTRGERGMAPPSALEVLQAGDVLALAGSHEAVRAAAAALRGDRARATPAGNGAGT